MKKREKSVPRWFWWLVGAAILGAGWWLGAFRAGFDHQHYGTADLKNAPGRGARR
jgi:hypothetical protein